MKISIIQPDIIWEKKSSNFSRLNNLVMPLSNQTDLVILPEMFNTGFSMNADKLAEAPDGDTYQWMREKAKAGNFGICGSYIVRSRDHFFNRWVFVSPDDETRYYDKRHLFTMGNENNSYSKGSSRLVFDFRGIRICPFICYDLRFPVWIRNRGEYDLAVFVANWPESRIKIWDILIRARAIENQCFVAGANRVGSDGNGIKYCGNSALVDAKGDLISFAGSEEGSFTIDISITDLNEFREKFPVLEDSDTFNIL